jgi:prepilin-type N-terminal cleavage/methylation domain-containing protein
MPNQNSKSFTLIELLIVLALISILTTILILTINPGGIFSKARDTKRINDLKNIEKIIDTLYFTEYNFNELNYVSPNVIYISLKDSSSTCGSYLSELPSLPPGWSYHCSATPTNIDGIGWIPIPFNNFPILNISQLFIDPINKPPYYYTFVFKECNEFTALLENNYEYIIPCSINRLTPISRGTLRNFLATIGGDDDDYAYSIQQTSDGGYIMAGHTYSFGTGGSDVFIVKLDSSGNVSECGYVFSASPTVLSQSPTVLSPSPTFYTQNPAVFSQSPTVSSLNITPSYQCRP